MRDGIVLLQAALNLDLAGEIHRLPLGIRLILGTSTTSNFLSPFVLDTLWKLWRGPTSN
jgi:hypothetical protein